METLAERISRMLCEDFDPRTDDGDSLAARIVAMVEDDRRAAHAAGRAEGEGSADSLRARLAYVQGGQEQMAAVSAWLAVSTVREVVIGRTKDGSGIRAQAQVWEGAGRVQAECVGEDVALALEALGSALK